MIHRFTLLLLLVATGTGIFAQNRLTGTVKDHESGEALPYAQVRWKKAGLGALTNGSGQFSLPPSDLSGDTLRVSYIGYEVVQIAAKALPGGEIEFRLRPAAVSLAEVLITPTDPRDLIRQAVADWPENNRVNDVNLEGFFREVLAENGRYVQLNEAVVAYHFPSDPSSASSLKVVKARTLQDSTEYKSIKITMTGEMVHKIVSLDPTSEMIAESFLMEENFKLYEYHLDTVLYREDRPTYVIRVDQGRRLRKKLYSATVLIDVRTNAFAGVSFQFSDRGKQFRMGQLGIKAAISMPLAKAMGYEMELTRHSGRMEFLYQNGTWLPTYIRKEVSAFIQEPKLMGGFSGTTSGTYELAVSNIRPGTPISASDQLPRGEKLNSVATQYEDSFWEDLPYLAPNESLRKIAKGLLKE